MLKLNGKPLDLRPAPPTVVKILAVVKKLADDDLLDVAELAKQIHASPAALRLIRHENVLPHRAVIQLLSRKMVVFGNAPTIKRLKKELESA